MDFVGALKTSTQDAEPFKFIPLDQFNHELKEAELEGKGINVKSEDGLDLLDSMFIAFHSEVKEYMLQNYGLLGRSEAYLLHQCIVRFVSVTPLDGEESVSGDERR